MKTFAVILFIFAFSLSYSQTKPDDNQNIRAKNQFLFIDYQPFFPIGLYSFPNKRNDDAIWKEASDAGFNFVLANEPGRFGMKVSRPIPNDTFNGKTVSMMEVHRGKQVQNKLLDFLNEHETDTTMICWHAKDEPSWHGPSAEVVTNGYDFISNNSEKPVWLNMGPSFLSRENYAINTAYLESCDIISEDIYPVPHGKHKKGQGTNIHMELVGEHAAGIIEIASINKVQQKPLWMVLQAFGWSSLNDYFDNPDDYLPPTMAELRFMVYNAIVNGATGIIFWGLEFESLETEQGTAIWEACKNVATELQELNPVLTSLTHFNNDFLLVENVQADSEASPVQHLIKVVGGDVYVLVVNTSAKPQNNVRFTPFPAIGGTLTNVTECTTNKELSVSNERYWQDTIEGFGVRVYKTDIRYDFFPKTKKH
jgi:hypothetical protein